MQASDNAGRQYLKINQARDGQIVDLNDGFSCCRKGKITLHECEGQLFFWCDEGMHFLANQAADGIHCVGVYPQLH
jgi:hypothetical protein